MIHLAAPHNTYAPQEILAHPAIKPAKAVTIHGRAFTGEHRDDEAGLDWWDNATVEDFQENLRAWPFTQEVFDAEYVVADIEHKFHPARRAASLGGYLNALDAMTIVFPGAYATAYGWPFPPRGRSLESLDQQYGAFIAPIYRVLGGFVPSMFVKEREDGSLPQPEEMAADMSASIHLLRGRDVDPRDILPLYSLHIDGNPRSPFLYEQSDPELLTIKIQIDVCEEYGSKRTLLWDGSPMPVPETLAGLDILYPQEADGCDELRAILEQHEQRITRLEDLMADHERRLSRLERRWWNPRTWGRS